MEAEMTPEQVRAYADKVQFGECITFPNGLVIDKRPITYPQPVVSVPSVVQPPNPYLSFPPGQTWCQSGSLQRMTDPYGRESSDD